MSKESNQSPNKTPDRKQEIIQTAFGLFLHQGYETTSVQLIIDTLQISKGGFYHYFKTKEDILQELANQMATQSTQLLQPLLQDQSLNALEKLNQVFRITNGVKSQNREAIVTFARVFYSDSNILLRKKLTENSMNAVLPIITHILEQGKTQELFAITHPKPTATLILSLGTELSAAFSRYLVEDQDKQGPRGEESTQNPSLQGLFDLIESYTQGVERILGVQPGSLQLLDPAMVMIITGKGASND